MASGGGKSKEGEGKDEGALVAPFRFLEAAKQGSGPVPLPRGRKAYRLHGC